MREILLRAKEFGTGEWVQGTGVVTDGINTWIVSNKENTPVAFGTTHKKVCPETVGQWTGLADKNGVKIFEGDIVRHYNKIDIGMPNEYDVGEIRWYKKGCSFERTSYNRKGRALIGQHCVYEVIGNIHDKAVEDNVLNKEDKEGEWNSLSWNPDWL